MFRYVIFLLVGGLSLNAEASEQNSTDVLKIALYYESLCPYCKAFIVDQFYPGYKKLSSYLEVDLVPFGNARYNKTDDVYKFKCQHGELECYGNKVQACALAQDKGQDKVMEFVHCVMNHTAPAGDQTVVECAPKLDVPSDTLLTCAKGLQGDQLLAKYGDRTLAVKKLLKGVPSVFVNDKFDEKVSDDIVDDFVSAVCQLLSNKPGECPKDTDETHATNSVA